MSQEMLAQFKQVVFSDITLQEKIRDIDDKAEFVSVVIELGRDVGCEFTAEDVQAEMMASRRAWIERRLG